VEDRRDEEGVKEGINLSFIRYESKEVFHRNNPPSSLNYIRNTATILELHGK